MSAGISAGTVGGTSMFVPMIEANPFTWLGDQAKQVAADGFTSMMMGMWSAGMWLLKAAFGLIDGFTPNVGDSDLSRLYSVMLWIALAMAMVIAFGQIGLAVLRRDGRGFGTLVAGLIQYGVVVSCWAGVCAGIIAATSGLTKGILDTLLGVDSFSGYAAGDGFVDTVSGTVQAATLGVCSLFILIPAAFGHLIIMLVRSAALLILTATLPIAAAGALSDGTKSWMWKSIRWFLACALMEPMLALVLGLGTQFAWAGMPDGSEGSGAGGKAAEGMMLAGSSTSENIGVSVIGAVVLLVAAFAPLALFRLFAFVDPGTASGASFRSTMSANGGVSGLLSGKRGAQGEAGADGAPGSGAASESSPDGRTSSENGAESQTANRWQSSKAAKYGGKVGGVLGSAMSKTGQLAQAGASMSVDVLGQAGIGNQGYYDTSYSPGEKSGQRQRLRNPQTIETPGVANDPKPGGGGSGAAAEMPADIPPVA